MNFETEQEKFWAGCFGDEYINRNKSQDLLSANISFFAKIFHGIERPNSMIEYGPNIGMNMIAIKMLFPSIKMFGVEINQKASEILKQRIGDKNVYNGSIFDYRSTQKYDLSLSKGFLIHVNPGRIEEVYDIMYESTRKYMLICEYYNPTPVSVSYRGYKNKLFKRDFAGDILNRYNDVSLVNYGFAYRNDPLFPQDDITWFLLRKKGSMDDE